MQKSPICANFNYAVLHIQRILLPDGFDTTQDECQVDTLEKVTRHYEEEGRILVWSGGSDKTIYGDPKVNHAFRAWHDYLHVTMQATFTPAGERNVCEKHKRQIDLYLSHKFKRAARDYMHRILDIEINEQVAELHRTGQFVDDQYQFTLDRL